MFIFLKIKLKNFYFLRLIYILIKILRYLLDYQIWFIYILTMTTKLNKKESKYKKFKGFKNRFQQTNLIQAIFNKKKVWDIINKIQPESTIITSTKKNDENDSIGWKVIKQRVNSNL